jgi:5-methylcytosine-specific restriction endonuclease McrA
MPSIPKNEPRRAYQRKPQPKRGTGDQSFYNSQVWRKARKAYISEHPNNGLCRASLEQGEYVTADVIDHIIPISAGGAKLHADNFMPLSHRYHNRKRGLESHGFVPQHTITPNGRIPTKQGIKQTLDKLLKR